MNRNVSLGALGRAAVFASLALTSCGGTSGDIGGFEEPGTGAVSSDLGAVNILTRNYNSQRTSANLSETVLSSANVCQTTVSKAFQMNVDGELYAQPLYASGVTIAGGTHNVVYLATVNNTVYAFDADVTGSPLWQHNFTPGGEAPVMNTQVGQQPGQTFCNPYADISGKIGILGTPVIDGPALTMYFVKRTFNSGTGAFVQRLHAIDITTGNDKPGSPVTITASVSGSAPDAVGGIVSFNPQTQNQRSGLALAGGFIYIAWSSHCDVTPYHGWVMAYRTSDLGQQAAFNVSRDGTQGGIWQSGGAPAIDASGNVYYGVGNGTANTPTGFGESVVKLNQGTLALNGFYTAGTFAGLNGSDTDFGSSGTVLLPSPAVNRLFTGGKDGMGYLLDPTNLGGFNSNDTQIPQKFQGDDPTVKPTFTHHLHSSAVVWNGPQGLNMYLWGENDFLRSFKFNTSTQKFTTPAAVVGAVLPPQGMPGGFMALSANGATPGSGVLWTTTPTSGDANHMVVAGTVRAFNAETLSLLWDSTGAANDMGNLAKYNPPVVANGKVYVASFSNKATVYKMTPPAAQTPFAGTINIPGTIQAENYDNGGQCSGYFDTDATNNGGVSRNDGVDIQATTDTGGGFNVGWTARDEWLEYTVNVQTAGIYNVDFRVAAMAAGGKLHLEVDNAIVTPTLTLAATGGWQTWTTVTVPTTTSLTTGQHQVRIAIENGGFNLNWVSLTQTTQNPFNGTPWPIPGTIQAENYDTGGQGVAYSDSDVGNNGGQYRTDNVDIEATTDTGGGVNVGWTAAGEWLEYTVNVASTGTRTLGLRLAATAAGNTLHVELDGANISGTVPIPNTNGWQTWQTVSVTTTSLSAGQHVLRVFFDTGGCNLNWISL